MTSPTPPEAPPPRGLLARLKSFLAGPGVGSSTPHPRWPHRTSRWLDPNVPLNGWRNRVDVADAPDALRAIADTSEGRIDAAAVAEVLDVVASEPEPASFRFGASNAFRQVWIGIAPIDASAVRIFLLSDNLHIAHVEAALSVEGFHHLEKRLEYDHLGRFLVAIWEWRDAAAPPSLRGGEQNAALIAEQLKRTISDPRSPVLEVMRGLRKRAREVLSELGALDEATRREADEWLARRGAPTLAELRHALEG